MNKTYTIILTAAEDSALSYAALSQQDWMDNIIKERCRIAIDDIVKITVEQCLETNTQIPGSKDEMVALAFERGWVKTAAERNTEAEEEAARLATLEQQTAAE